MTAADLVAFLLFILLVVVYWSPYVIAMQRKSDKTTAIALTLLFFGLTGVGWIIALIWALRLPKRPSKEALDPRNAEIAGVELSLAPKTQEPKRDVESASHPAEAPQALAPLKLHN
jgi:type VI protein secretion system component VasK